jgi:pyruvate formate lyase activating enzyme
MLNSKTGKKMDTQELYSLVAEGGQPIDAVVFSGGEPTLQPDALYELADAFKKNGLSVKIDTNGSNSGAIVEMLARNIIDYIALDVKAPLDREREYSNLIQTNAEPVIKNIKEILKLRRVFPFVLECRTTIVPGLIFREHEIEEIAKQIAGHCDLYVLQQFTPDRGCLDKEYTKLKPPTRQELLKLAKIAKKHIPDVRVRTAEGEEKA